MTRDRDRLAVQVWYNRVTFRVVLATMVDQDFMIHVECSPDDIPTEPSSSSND
ncbi:MAG: hypothetical protein IIC28_12840 [Chloroflexi bacterium]|nr:hypothetical protein [Chloroflexota bacterium]